MEHNSEVLSGLVLKRIRDGRCRYDPQIKQELVERSALPAARRVGGRFGHAARCQREFAAQMDSCLDWE